MKNVWEFLNGKKTALGGTALALALFLSNIQPYWFEGIEWITSVIESLEYFGGFLVPFGLTHKKIKAEK